MTDCFFRLMENNFAELTQSGIVFTSALTAFPGLNVINKFRSRTWRPSGHFEITANNRNLYFNDGIDKIANISIGNYTTPQLLATEIQTRLNAISTGWVITYDTSMHKFILSNAANVYLRNSINVLAIWDTIGFITNVNTPLGTVHIADEQRNHTHEAVTFDLGYNAQIDFFACIGPLDEDFTVSDSAVIKLQANNILLWDTPPIDITLLRSNDGLREFLEGVNGYRYWRFYVQDRLNPLGPSGLSFGHIYLGTQEEFSRNISTGFELSQVDPSTSQISEAGAIYFDEKAKYTEFDRVEVGLLPKADRENLRKIFNRLGTTTPFYIAADPLNKISENQDFTKYVIFSNEPSFSHIIFDIFSMNMRVREVL